MIVAVVAMVAVAVVVGIAVAADSDAEPLHVSAATSLTAVLPKVDADARYSFGGSNVLERQIERGAPTDLFLSAAPAQAQALHRAGRCGRPVAFASNELVLIVGREAPASLRSVADLRRGGLRLSVGNANVPVGAYTRELLGRLRLASVLKANQVSEQGNVGQVLSQVAFGGAQAGFVYATDARTQRGRVRVIALPRSAQPVVAYQGCVVERDGGDAEGARRLLAQLRAPRAQRVLRQAGFGPPPAS